jgi:hypothetical protein
MGIGARPPNAADKALAAKPRLTVMVSRTDVEPHRRRTVRRARNGPRRIRDHSQGEVLEDERTLASEE